MKLLKGANSEFARLGSSLESQFDSTMDSHYFCFNFGDSPCKTSAECKFYWNHEEMTEISNLLFKDFKVEKEIFAIVFRIKCKEVSNAKKEMEKFINDHVKKFISDTFGFEEVSFTYKTSEDELSILMLITNEMVLGIIKLFKESIIKQFGKDLKVNGLIKISHKNPLKKYMDRIKDKFISLLLEGITFEFKVGLNAGLLKNIRKYLIQKLSESIAKKPESEKSSITNLTIYFSMLKSSKFHLSFRDFNEVEPVLEQLGIKKLLADQPSVEAIFTELKDELEEKINGFDNNTSEMAVEFLKILNKYALGNVNIGVKLPNSLISLNINGSGFKEIGDYLFEAFLKYK